MISATTPTTTSSTQSTTSTYENPDGILGKDDFLKLLLTQLQYQDPTEPTDAETILTQTSQLAALESAENTNKALESLAKTLANGDQLSVIAAIGKTADMGSNAIAYDKTDVTFEMYFPSDVASGNIEVLDSEGQIVQTITIPPSSSGVEQFTWDGTLSTGGYADPALYYITASYKDPAGTDLTSRLGTYPIESVRFDEGKTLVKVGSNYVPVENIKEIY